MKTLLSFAKKDRSIISRIKKLTITILFSGIFITLGFSQTETQNCFAEEYVFTNTPEQTLCDDYGNSSFNLVIGEGASSGITNSSQIGTQVSDYIHIVGDFTIDNHFEFNSSIVKIEPGVVINMELNKRLNLNSSKLFACNELWVGIVMGHGCSVRMNGTEIEDAEAAIQSINRTYNYLEIINSTFNRNNVGIKLEVKPYQAHPPLFGKLFNNRFKCDAPLNGTVDGISFAGIEIKNIYLFSFQTGINYFRDLIYGIYAEGSTSKIGTKNLSMRRIKKDGIFLKEGSINLEDSFFSNCEEKGINIETVNIAKIQGVDFIFDTQIPENSTLDRSGVYIKEFNLNADVKLFDNTITADMEGTLNRIKGFFLRGGNVGAGTKIKIVNNEFRITATNSMGINLRGDFPPSSTTEIWLNRFRISNIDEETGGRPSGIETSGGNKNNLSIKWNSFTSNYVKTFEFPTVGIPQWNYGIFLRHNMNGLNNEVKVNSFNYEVQTMQFGILVHGFQHMNYSCNSISGFGFATAVNFLGICTDTDFTENTMNFAGSRSLNIQDQTFIGTQEHRGNMWQNLSGFESTHHARYQGSTPEANKFIVHTEQSTCNVNTPSNPSCFNEFHPRKIEPDQNDEFFEQQIGFPPEDCLTEFQDPDADELDLIIAQGLYTSPSNAPSLKWQLDRYLYQKLNEDTSLLSISTSFPAFLTSHSNTTVGNLYDFNTKIQNAFEAADSLSTQSKLLLDSINILIDLIAEIDSLNEFAVEEAYIDSLTQLKQGLVSQIQYLHLAYNNFDSTYYNQVLSDLQIAYNLNENLTTTFDYEENEKEVNRIYLLSLLQQNGNITETQISDLQMIAQQHSDVGGPSVFVASGLLPECLQPDVDSLYSESIDSLLAIVPPITEIPQQRQYLIQQNQLIKIFPNPSNSSFTIQTLNGKGGKLSMMDITGKLLFNNTFSGNETLVELPPDIRSGIYLITIVMNDGYSVTEKLIVQLD